jgi:hypothetical protein
MAVYRMRVRRVEEQLYEVTASSVEAARRSLVGEGAEAGIIPTDTEMVSEEVIGICLVGGPFIWHCPGCGTVVGEGDEELIGEHILECARVDGGGEALPGVRRPYLWHCPGCGFRTREAELVVDHVSGCDLVDGAGQAIWRAA